MQVTLKECRNAINRSGIPGVEYCLNPYTGCGHACIYCYASFMRRFTAAEQPWGTFVQVKKNVADRLAAQLRRPKQGLVMLSSVTDAYQPVEEQYRLTRACLQLLGDSNLTVSILTKSDLILRDLDLLKGMRAVQVGFSFTVADDRVARWLEPGATPPSKRLRAMRRLTEAGLSCWVFVAPVIPGLGDATDNLETLAREIHRSGVHDIRFDPLNFYSSTVNNLSCLYTRYFPHLLPQFRLACANPAAYRAHTRSQLGRYFSC